MRDHRIGLDLFTDVLDVLHRHGFARGDNQHAGRAIFLISDLARIYEGTQDHPSGHSVNPAPSPQTAPEPHGHDSRDPVTVPASELKTVLAALDIAADYKRDRAEMCTDCPDQSCPTCQTRLHDAQAYDQMAYRMLQSAEAAQATHHRQTECQPARPANPGTRPTKRPASDQPRQDARRTRNPPPSRRSPCPRPAAGGQGHARDPGPL